MGNKNNAGDHERDDAMESLRSLFADASAGGEPAARDEDRDGAHPATTQRAPIDDASDAPVGTSTSDDALGRMADRIASRLGVDLDRHDPFAMARLDEMYAAARKKRRECHEPEPDFAALARQWDAEDVAAGLLPLEEHNRRLMAEAQELSA